MPSPISLEKTRSTIGALRFRIEQGQIPRASHEWGGADVIIVTRARGSRYKELVTPFASELSWLFLELRDAFVGLIDGFTKFEFYGRLETAANDAIINDKSISCAALCMVVVDTADQMLSEMTCACAFVSEVRS